MGDKEEIFKNINHFKFLLELENEMLDIEKSLKKSCINFIILNIITLVVYALITTIRGKSIDIMDIIIVSALMSSANQELSQVVACNSNIRKYDFRISELENKLEELNMELKNL